MLDIEHPLASIYRHTLYPSLDRENRQSREQQPKLVSSEHADKSAESVPLYPQRTSSKLSV